MRSISRLINFRGELFSSTFTYGVAALIKLGSSLILTRLLNPEAYGIFAILFSILYMVELLSDVGSSGLLISSRPQTCQKQKPSPTVRPAAHLVCSGFGFD